MTVIVTGGAGFTGSALVRALVADGEHVVTIDKLTYAGNPDNLAPVFASQHHVFIRADICDRIAMARALHDHRPCAVYHLAAESHVDRTIDTPATCIETNIVGTATLLEATLDYWRALDPPRRPKLYFISAFTDRKRLLRWSPARPDR